MKLWDKGFSTEKKIEWFTVGNDRELDLVLARYDVMGSEAHVKMLADMGVFSPDECKAILGELSHIATQIDNGAFTIEPSFEDVHSKIEYLLTEKLGDTGKKIHTARSRNDQILVDMHLYFKNELAEISRQIAALFQLFIKLARQHRQVLLPGYTHLQVAMPSSFGLWFSAYAECLIDDVYVLTSAWKTVDQNPLGSAAGYGSSFPIDRQKTTDLLGFKTLKYNSVAAQMSRGKSERVVAMALASVAGTLSKWAMDVCLYMSQNFGFISFPDNLTTGSSIMPHKKNPDVFELIRGKCNKIQSLPYEMTLITNNLPSGYHRDLQLLKEAMIPAVETLKACLDLALFSLEKIEVNTQILEQPIYDYLFTVEAVNKSVLQGVPFREAYRQVGQSIEQNTFVPDKNLNHTHQGSIGQLCLEEIEAKMKAALKELGV